MRKIPVTIRGTTYPSMTHAAKALNVAVSNVSNAYYTGLLDGVGTGRRGAEKPTWINGVTYRSRTDAARALGVSHDRVNRWVQNGVATTPGLL